MERLVIDYLKRYYILGEKIGLDCTSKIYVIYYYDKLIYWDDLSKQLITIFGINEELAKFYVGKWAWENNYDLLKYWDLERSPFDDLAFPEISRIYPTTIAMDLVPVQALSMPKMDLHYFDYVYKKEPWYKIIKNKIIDYYFVIKEKISTFVNKVKIWKKN